MALPSAGSPRPMDDIKECEECGLDMHQTTHDDRQPMTMWECPVGHVLPLYGRAEEGEP